MENMEKRSFETEVRSHTEDDKPTIEGYAAVYNVRSEVGPGMFEEILPGAFDERIKKDDIRALFNHDKNNILGRLSANTLELRSDAKGLYYRIYPPDTQAGRDVVTSIKRGDITGSSFSFKITGIDDDFRSIKHGVLRTVKKFSGIGDVGPVIFPAYDQATVSARSKEQFEAEAERFKKEQEKFADPTEEEIKAEAEARQRRLQLAERG